MVYLYLCILTGISFAGKSVPAQAISRERGWPIVDPDAAADEMGLWLHGEFLPDAQSGIIYAEAEQHACRLLCANKSVIFDTTAFTREQREELRRLAEECRAEALVVYVWITREEALCRWETNNQTHERFPVLIDDFTMVADEFRPPMEEEPHQVYHADEDIVSWIREDILADSGRDECSASG